MLQISFIEVYILLWEFTKYPRLSRLISPIKYKLKEKSLLILSHSSVFISLQKTAGDSISVIAK